ncbi:helix-turn-helix transcriptional regulator [Clostridium algidicarnis]|uniref:helix-turn-helix transcriptional regulator n=1 Tax=Clostridium algidicarnis TaxID=37659 RepID=UPI001C0D7464|nr:helix-turn-helix transcriptional regulator [Clostridium algidicarnis]MBU3204814.1 helix-turn-helix transcriptional regulator [Clostridium algidicarnis]MBU3212968.1 helix-turn-helix transcriptional regulator [Clostridium algidicarnis]MBU3223625.1 helix-turn-helix transcriptional regulator [Clostridium algidicarnis]
MKLLSQGQKLKNLRTKLNLTQKDLVIEGVTREFISMVEKEKRHFSKATAICFMQNIIKYAKIKSIDMDSSFDEEYLSRTIKEDAEMYCKLSLEKCSTMEEYLDILSICKEYEIYNVMIIIYKKVGDKLLNEVKAVEAFINYDKAMEIIDQNNITEYKIRILNNMGICKLRLLQYNEAIYYFNKSIELCHSTNDYKIYNKVLYNTCLVYSNMKNVYKALQYIKEAKERKDIKDEKNIFIKIRIIEALCYEDIDDYNKAIEIYKDLEDNLNIEDNIIRGNIYNNLAIALFENKEYEESKSYFGKSKELRSVYDRSHLARTFMHESIIYINLNQYNQAIDMINEGLNLCNEYNDYEYLNKGYKYLEDIYKAQKDYNKLKETYNNILYHAKINNNIKEEIYGLSSLIKLEISLKNYEVIGAYMDKLNESIDLIANKL